MIRFLAMLVLLSLGTVSVQAQDELPWRGVYEGKIGSYPVIACFDAWGSPGDWGGGKGSYYYLSQMKPIPLRGDQPYARWWEGGGDDGPVWQIAQMDGERVSGNWRDRRRILPIKLTRIADGGEDWDRACASANFLAPRVTRPAFAREAAMLGAFGYTSMRYVAPAHFTEVAVESFAYPASEPGDSAIQAELDAVLPKGTVEDEFIQCLAGSLGSLGIEGDFSLSLAPTFANSELLGVTKSSGSFCGGAHPNYWQEYTVFDRQSGGKLDPKEWFNPRGFADNGYGSLAMQAPLRSAVLEQWPADVDAECRDIARDAEYWTVGLSAEGLMFQPDLPHVATACEEIVALGWDELAPLLDEAGQQIVARAARP